MHVAISATKVGREEVAISTTSTPCSASLPGPLHPLREVVLELLELITGTSWACRMAGGQSAQRRGKSSQGPANPKKAQAKGKSRSPRGKGGGSAGGDQRGEGGRGRGSPTTPTPKAYETGPCASHSAAGNASRPSRSHESSLRSSSPCCATTSPSNPATPTRFKPLPPRQHHPTVTPRKTMS